MNNFVIITKNDKRDNLKNAAKNPNPRNESIVQVEKQDKLVIPAKNDKKEELNAEMNSLENALENPNLTTRTEETDETEPIVQVEEQAIRRLLSARIENVNVNRMEFFAYLLIAYYCGMKAFGPFDIVLLIYCIQLGHMIMGFIESLWH